MVALWAGGCLRLALCLAMRSTPRPPPPSRALHKHSSRATPVEQLCDFLLGLVGLAQGRCDPVFVPRATCICVNFMRFPQRRVRHQALRWARSP